MSCEPPVLALGTLLYHAGTRDGVGPRLDLFVMVLGEYLGSAWTTGDPSYRAVVIRSADDFYYTGEKIMVYAQDIGSVWAIL